MGDKRENGISKSAMRAVDEISARVLSSKEISGIGSMGTMRLLKGRFAKAMNYVGHIFSYSSSRSYGCFFLSFGLLTLFLNLGEYYFADVPVSVFRQLIFGICMMAFSVPFLFSDKPLCIAFQNFKITDYLFFEFFSVKRMHTNYDCVTIPPIIAFVIGFIPAVLGFFLPLGYVALSLAVLIIVTVAFLSPEFLMVLSLLLLPYLSAFYAFKLVLALLSVIAFVSFMVKVAVGKRVFNLDAYSVLIFLWIIASVIRGISSPNPEALTDSFYFAAMLLGYFPAANLVVNRRLADRAMKAVIVSAVPVAILAIIKFIVEISGTRYTTPGISVSFLSPEALSTYLFVAALLTMAFSLEKKNKAKKTAYFIIFLVDVFVVFLTLEPIAWLSVIITVPTYFILTSKKIPRDIVFLMFAAVHFLFLLPPALFDTLYKAIGLTHTFSDKLASLQAAVGVFSDNLLWGLGAGGVNIIQNPALSSGVNLVLGIGMEFGIFILVAFAFMIALRLRQLSHYERLYPNSLVSDAIHMTSLATLCMLFFGLGNYIFSDSTLTYLFFAIFGFSSAALRTAKKEHEDRFGYYRDARSVDSSAIDVAIKD